MGLPVLGKPQPAQPPTHAVLDLDRLMKLGVAVENAAERAGTAELSAELLEELADDLGVPASHLYAAAAMTTDLRFARTDAVAFVCCAGGCQGWGSLDRIDQLLALRRARAEAGLPGFDVLARNCLDRCAQAPAVLADTGAGTALISPATGERLGDAVAELCSHRPN